MITLIQSPQTFTPASNPIRFAFTTDNTNVVFFRINVSAVNVETLTSGLITTLDIYPTPKEPTIGRVDLSSVLQDYVTSNYRPDNSNLYRHSENVIGIGLTVYQFVYNPTTGVVTQDGTSFSAAIAAFVYTGKLDRISFSNYSAVDYTMTTSSLSKFLTTKQYNVNVHTNYYTKEYLYYFQSTPKTYVALQVVWFDFTNVQQSKMIIYSTALQLNKAGIIRVDASPAVIFTTSELLSLKRYTVQLIQSNSTSTTAVPMSYAYQYTYHNDVCQAPIYIHWQNPFGVFETSEFVINDNTLNTTNTLTTLNTNTLNGATQQDYNDYNNQRFFTALERNLNVNTNYNIKLTTRPLRDSEMNFLQGLMISKKIYLQMDTNYIPVVLSDNTYSLTPNKHLQQLNTKTFNFKVSDGYILY